MKGGPEMKKRNSRSTLFAIGLALLALFPVNSMAQISKTVTISKSELMNKIKGGWAGQTIGVCYALPTEFRYKKEMIPDSVKMDLTGEQLKKRFNNDDIYMDAKFVEVIGRLGLDAPADAFATAFANAGFNLWHANQAARYNILNGIMPPKSGHWKYSMHSDDIDFQIEADFAGLTSAGVLDAAVKTADKVGHIMNHGDGWYSGVYVAAMYSLAFVSDDVDFVVNEALKLIPEQSKYYRAMSDVIQWHKEYPNDWTKTWREIEESQWSYDLHCTAGVYQPFNIDATVNMAYVLIGLLYGEGDFFKSMDISMRCGQDSDCNPSSVGGILGAMMGYDKIPAKWLNPYKEIEDVTLNYTSVSLNDCYDICYKSSIENIVKYGGKVDGDEITIEYHRPKTLPLEVAYPNIYPKEILSVDKSIRDVTTIEFSGTGIAVLGGPSRNALRETNNKDYVAEIEVSIDGKKAAVRKLPFNYHSRALEVFFDLELSKGNHVLELEWLNPVDGLDIPISNCIVFSDVLVKDGIISNKWQSSKTLNEDGLLGQRVDLWRNNRLWFIAESGYLIDGFEKRPGTHAWQGEHLGKWLHAASLAYQVTGDEKLKKELDDMVKRLMATQLPDGYLGTYPEEARFMNVPENEDYKLVTDDIETKESRKRTGRGGWDTWTFRYNLYGLLTYEKCFPNEQVVEACRKMADLLIKTYGTDKSDLTKYGTRKGISATTLLESIVMLYERTSDKKYLDFAEEIVLMSENNPDLRLMGTMLNNGSVVHPGEGKGYQLMANMLGYLRLYRCTGNENYLKAVTYAWNDIHKNHILVTGGPWSRKMPYNGNGECFARTDAFHPEKIRVEGCCDATWIQLNIHLFEFTGQAKYMNEAEMTLLNSVYGHQHADGKEWCYFIRPNEAKMAYEERFHCCGSSEPRGMEMYSDHLAGTIGENLSINTLFPAAIQVANRFGGGRIEIEGKFPLESSAEIHIETLKKKKFTLEFRLPANTSLIHVVVNGQKTAAKKNARGFFELTRMWRKGDMIAVDMNFDLKASVQVGEGNKQWVAFNYGPHALAQKITAIPDEEPFSGMNEKETSKMLRMLSKSSDSEIAFSIKGTDITLLPYYMTCTKQSGPRTYFKL